MLPDIQFLRPEVPIRINRVGVVGVKKLVEVERTGKRPIILISKFDVFVDLPEEMKGANLSRNFEAIDEVLEALTERPVKKIEDLCLKIAETLLNRHEYATKAEVKMDSELILKKRTPVTARKTQEVVKIIGEAVVWRNGGRRVFVGAEVVGVTACPCAQEMVKARVREKLRKMGFGDEDIDKILNAIPLASHNQRGRALIKIEVRDFTPNIDKLIEIAKKAMSGEIYEVLKREDELEVVWKAHLNPRFVEDCVRLMAKMVIEEFPNAPDDVIVFFRQENEESIHQHNVVAEKIATMGELRRELSSYERKV